MTCPNSNQHRKSPTSLLWWLVAVPLVLSVTRAANAGEQRRTDERPNLVFIICDDLNDLPLSPQGKPAIATPNIDRLARRGVRFTNAHTNDPICAPARACLLFGIYPQTSGLFWFENWRQNDILNRCVSLNQHLMNNGYSVYGTGKIYHGGRGDGAYDEFGYRPEFGPWPWDGKSQQSFQPHPAMMYLYETDGDIDFQWEHHFGPLSMIPDWPADAAKGIPGYKGWRLYNKPYRYVNDRDRDPLCDELSADWAREIVARKQDRPFALFTGFIRTHTPLYAPDEYFNRFPLDSIETPKTIENDLDDCARVLADRSLYGFRRYQMLVRHKDRPLYKQWLQAYLACVSFVDDQVGKVLDAVDRSPERDNTIVIFTSDHGFHMGEKEFLYKQSLWDGATRVPLIIAGVKGMPRGVACDRPVSLIDLYPTVNELCGLPRDPNVERTTTAVGQASRPAARNSNGKRVGRGTSRSGYPLEGHSLKPLLMNPDGGWTGPDVAIMALPGKDHSQHQRHGGTWFPHFSVRSQHYRYTLCADGEEELYDFGHDAFEWHNLANDSAYAKTKASLKSQLIALRDGPNWKSLNQLGSWSFGLRKGGATQKGGALEFVGGKTFYLTTAKQFRNFEMEFDLKSPDANQMRLSYRAKVIDNRIAGTVATIPPAPSNLEGKEVPFRVGDWNRYRIRVVEGRCRVWINARLYSDVRSGTGSRVGTVGIDFPGATTPTTKLKQVRIRAL